MKKLLNKKIIVSLAVVIGVFTGINDSYATSSIIQNDSPTLIQEGSEPNRIISESATSKTTTIQGGGTLEKAEAYVESKLFDVVGFLQSFIKPLTYVTFIISTIIVLFGIVTDSRSKVHGFLGMAFSVLVYVTVMFAPQLVEYFGSWLAI